MVKISEERLAKYRALADRGLWEINDEEFRAFYARAAEEGVELVSNNFTTLGMYRAPHRKDLAGVDIALVGIPMDIGVPNPRPGTRLGPKEVRYWSLDRNLVHYLTRVCPFDFCSIIDWGDVEFTSDAYNLEANLETIHQVYSKFRAADVVPLTIGGEHTCTYGILKALSRNGEEPLAFIHLDAHGDTSVGFGGTRISDATFLQAATVDGFIDTENTIQIGLRGRGLPRCDFSYDSGMRVVLADEVSEKGVPAVLKEIQSVIGDHPCYLSIDTDVFDCSVMPGTTLPEPFGLTGHQVREIILGSRGLDIVGSDLMELSPPYDPTGMSACLASGIAFEMLCLLAEARARRTDQKRKTHWNL
jgi:agmatinase